MLFSSSIYNTRDASPYRRAQESKKNVTRRCQDAILLSFMLIYYVVLIQMLQLFF